MSANTSTRNTSRYSLRKIVHRRHFADSPNQSTEDEHSSSFDTSNNSYTITTHRSNELRLTVNLKRFNDESIPKKTSTPIIQTPRTRRRVSNMRLIREGTIRPTMQKRIDSVQRIETPLSQARNQLHVSYLPKQLTCREEEFSNIHNFLEGKLHDNCGGCIYISGVPGTGKTATVSLVVNALLQDMKRKSVPKFDFVSINGLKLTEARQAYVEIVKQLNGKTLTWEQSQNFLQNRFASKKNKSNIPLIILADEVDMICTKRQDVVYNLLDWPSKSVAPLIVIAIANTMDLPERLLMGKVASRLGLTRLPFKPYTYRQLQEIVSKRLEGIPYFNKDAMQLVARKVASVSGDARRALDICRRAVEMAEDEGDHIQVGMEHVNNALNVMITQPKVRAVRHCSKLEQLILQSVVAEAKRTGVEETNFMGVYKTLISFGSFNGVTNISSTMALAAVTKLSLCRLLLCDQKGNDINCKIILNISPDDVHYALREE